MKDFLFKLYSNSNFPIILFSIIGVLIVLFVIVLIMAIHDANKTRELEEQNNNGNDLNNNPNDNNWNIEVPKLEEEKIEIPKLDNSNVEQQVSIPEPVISIPQPVVEDVSEPEVKVPEVSPYQDFSFDDSETKINNEIPSLANISEPLNLDSTIFGPGNVPKTEETEIKFENNYSNESEYSSISNDSEFDFSNMPFVSETKEEPQEEFKIYTPNDVVENENTVSRVVDEEVVLPMPKPKVVSHEPVVNVKSLDDIEKEEFIIGR